MNISSSSLFRFTTKFEYLMQIVRDGFTFRKCVEKLAIGEYENDPFAGTGAVLTQLHSWAVCFCDLPLGDSKDHRKQYGEYAIAMTKEWAMKRGVTPIRYYHSNSPDHGDSQTRLILDILVSAKQHPDGVVGALRPFLASQGMAPSKDDFNALPESVRFLISTLNSLSRDCLEHYWKTLQFTRVYEDEWTDRVTGETVIRRFYDEREWRAVAFSPDDRLPFFLGDVRRIIVTTDAERRELGELILSMRNELKVPDEPSVWSLIQLGDLFLDA